MSKRQRTRTARQRLVSMLMALAVIFGTATVATVTSATVAQADVGTNDYTWSGATDCSAQYGEYSWCESGNDISPLGFGYRNCTDYVAYELNEQLGGTVASKKFSYSLDGFSDGNAEGWKSAITTKFGATAANGTPAIGSVAWYAGAANNGYFGHVALVKGIVYNHDGSVQSITVADYNYAGTGNYDSYSIASGASNWPGSFLHVADVTSSSGGGSGGGSTPSRQLIVNNNTDWAEDNPIGNGWTDETHTGDLAVAVGGGLMMIINSCGAVYALNSLTGVWTNESNCGDAKAIAVSANGTQMYLDHCNAINAQTGSPSTNWTQESGCGTAQAIAIGSDGTQMMIDACSAVQAKTTVGVGGWFPETGCGTAKAIAAGSGQIQVILNACNAVYAQYGISTNWNMEQNCGAAQSIAAAGSYQMLINACGEVYAANNITANWTPESPCNAATAIAVGFQGRQLYLGGNGHTYAEDSGTLGDFWTDETPGGGTTAIAVG